MILHFRPLPITSKQVKMFPRFSRIYRRPSAIAGFVHDLGSPIRVDEVNRSRNKRLITTGDVKW